MSFNAAARIHSWTQVYAKLHECGEAMQHIERELGLLSCQIDVVMFCLRFL